MTNNDENELYQFLHEWDFKEEITDNDERAKHNQWITEYGIIDPQKTVMHLNNQSTLHSILKQDIFKSIKQGKSSADNKYTLLINSKQSLDQTPDLETDV